MRIGIIGQFGEKNVLNDGQTIKTISLYEALKKRYPDFITVHRVDTYDMRHNPLKFCKEFLRSALQDEKIIVLLSKKMRRILFPVLYWMSRYMGKKIYHYGIGGLLAQEVSDYSNMRNYMASFEGNWLESPKMVQIFEEHGLDNAVYVPNFKLLGILKAWELSSGWTTPFKFCTFSRVMPEKGIEDAVHAIDAVNRKYGKMVAQLDIYGPVIPEYEAFFQMLMEQFSDCCKYCGVVPAYESVNTLRHYYVLLFPTRWCGEGCAGTIIDAMSSGLPVIARKWRYCDDMITHGKNGFVYDGDGSETLAEWIQYAMEHPEIVMGMKENCISKACDYSEETVMGQIEELLTLR